MLSRLLADPAQATPRERALWLALAAVAASQLLAFYVLCQHQVRQADARRASWQIEQVATDDCARTVGVTPECAPSDLAVR